MNINRIEELIADLTCDDTIKCQKARRLLVSMGYIAVPHLIKALDSPKRWVRWESAKALSQIADPAATLALITALEDKEADVRWLAAEGLVRIGYDSIPPLLQALVRNAKSQWLTQGAHHVLQDMNLGPLQEILDPVMEALEDFEPAERIPPAAGKALIQLEETTY